MSRLVSADEIEGIVGVERHPVVHYGHDDPAARTFYILHSRQCLDTGIDLRRCSYSMAVDYHGVDPKLWERYPNRPVPLTFQMGRVAPALSLMPDAKMPAELNRLKHGEDPS